MKSGDKSTLSSKLLTNKNMLKNDKRIEKTIRTIRYENVSK